MNAVVQSVRVPPQRRSVNPNTSSFVKDVMKLAAGTGTAQVLSLLAAPAVTRLFAPDAFGAAAIYLSLAGVMEVAVCLRYESSIQLPEQDEDAVNLMAGSLLLSLPIVLATLAIIWLGSEPLLRLFHATQLGGFIWLLPVSVMIGGINSVVNAWITRRRHFGRVTYALFAQSICIVTMQIGFGLAGFKTGGALIVASLCGLFVYVSILIIPSWNEFLPLARRSVSWERIKINLKRYVGFPRYSMPSAVLNLISQTSPTFLLSGLFSIAVAGQYSLNQRLLRVPQRLVGNNIARVFFQYGAAAKLDGTLTKVVENTFRYLVTMSLFPCLLLSLIGRDIFIVAFGHRWAEAGVYTQILSISIFFWFLAGPLNNLFFILEENALELRLRVLNIAVRSGALFLGGIMGGPRVALAAFSAAGVLIFGYYSITVMRKAGVLVSRIGGILISELRPALLFIAPVAALKYFGVRPLFILITSFALLALYFSHVLASNPTSRRALGNIFRKWMPSRSSSRV